jgi:hypothetical protein
MKDRAEKNTQGTRKIELEPAIKSNPRNQKSNEAASKTRAHLKYQTFRREYSTLMIGDQGLTLP